VATRNPDTRPQLWVVAGPNGAGKSTLVARQLTGRMPIINPDDIAFSLPRRSDGALDEVLAGREALRQRGQMLDSGRSFAIETTMAGTGPLRFMSGAAAHGYAVTLVYVGIASASLSLQRVRDRVAAGGHDVPVDAIMRRYPDTMGKLATALGIVDRAYIVDNSGTRRRLLIKIEDGLAISEADDLPKWAAGAVPAKYRKLYADISVPGA
jgi:predicted ABC-type ATPase